MDSTFDRWGEAVVYVGIVWGAIELGTEYTGRPRRRRDGLGVHGQLHPGPRREPRLRARQGHGQRRLRPARGPARHPHRRARPRASPAGRRPTGTGGVRTRISALVLDITLGLLALLATITTIQRIVVTLNQASREG